jgi:hypothetical protein
MCLPMLPGSSWASGAEHEHEADDGGDRAGGVPHDRRDGEGEQAKHGEVEAGAEHCA